MRLKSLHLSIPGTECDIYISHSLADMAKACGLYQSMWEAEGYAGDFVKHQTEALRELAADRETYEKFNPVDNWVNYDILLHLAAEWLYWIERNPEKTIVKDDGV